MHPMRQVTELTWYRGSIRPYASLWHTLMRVAALNGHKAGELPGWPAGLKAVGQLHRCLHPLHNPKGAFNTEVLAQALGEAPGVFRWSHLGALAPWLKPLVTPGFRVCSVCLSEGYHSALFSIRLMETCPLHGAPLLDHCQCGRAFRDRLWAPDFDRAGSCPCYSLPFLTPEVCRMPTLPAYQTQVLDGVVEWLEQLARVVRCAQRGILAPSTSNAVAQRQVCELSGTLGLRYPDCLRRPSASSTSLSCIHTHKGPRGLPRHSAAPRRPAPVQSGSSYWADTPASRIYKALSRYLRKHGVRHGESWGQRLTQLAHSDLQRALQQEPEAVTALTEMVWAGAMEPRVRERRWPYRNAWACLSDPLRGQLAPTGLMASADAWADASMDANTAFGNWLAYQAAGFTMLQDWRAATRQARQAELNGTWDWPSRPPEPFQCDWSAFLKSDGTFVFVGQDASPGGFPRLPLPNKVAREYALRTAQNKAWQTVLAACTGLCLTWTPEEGWFVTQAAQPAQGDWKRHRLLGLAGAKREFWLFGAGKLFAARLCDARLQTLGATPRDAITALRKWLPSYLRVSRDRSTASDGGKSRSEPVTLCSSLT